MRFCLTAAILIILAITGQAQSIYVPDTAQQSEKKGFDIEKMAVGGNFGLSFGNVTAIDLSPTVYYYLWEPVQVGTGFIYQYVNYRDYGYTNNVLGGRFFGRLFVFEHLFVHAEYLLLNTKAENFIAGNFTDKNRISFHNFLTGGGYNVPVGEDSFIAIMVLVNITENELYPTRKPFLSFGLEFGL